MQFVVFWSNFDENLLNNNIQKRLIFIQNKDIAAARLPGYSYGELTSSTNYILFVCDLKITTLCWFISGLQQVNQFKETCLQAPPPPPKKKQAYSTEYLLHLLQDKDNVKCVRIYMYRGVAYTNIIRKLSNGMQEMKIESSQSTDVLLFKRFIEKYTQFTTDMNNMHFSINSHHCPIPDDKKENVIFFLKSIDKLNNKYEGRFQGINRFVYIVFGRKV